MLVALTAALVFLTILLSVSRTSCVSAAGGPKGVHVQLRAKWIGTPLLLEAGEFLAQENGAHYWQYLDSWRAADRLPAGASDKECVAQILGLGKALSGPTMAPLLELSLSMRTLSPKLVLYRQLAQESLRQGNLSQAPGSGRWEANQNPDAPGGQCCWLDAGGKVLLGETQLAEWLDAAAQGIYEGSGVEVYEFDHVHPQSPQEGFSLVLYGSPGTACFETLHPVLAKAAQQNLVRYVYRPVLANGCESATARCARVGHGGAVNLGGYGVEMALKNMEYKAIDDSAVKKEELTEETKDEDLSQEVKGFVFSTLLERRPELRDELLTFREHLLASSQEEVRDAYSVWELKDLGIQASQRIVQASEPLRLLQEISQNFPTLVTSLSRVKVNETIAEELRSLQKMVQPGRTIITLNGLVLELDRLDIFSLLEQVQSELKLAAELATLQIPPTAVRQLAKVPPVSEDNDIRLDFRSAEHVHYLNDIERDAEYRSWRSNLNELLMPAFPGQMRAVRKNLFHAVYVVDPASHIGFKALEEVGYYYRNRLPVRMGLLLASPKQVARLATSLGDVAPSDWDEEDLSDLVIRMFLHIKRTRGVKPAFEFLEAAAEDPSAMEDSFGAFGLQQEVPQKPITQELFEEAFLSYLSDDPEGASAALDALKGGASPEAAAALGGTRHLYELGLGDSHPCLLFNGLYFGPMQMFGAAMDALNTEMQEVQRAVYFQKISSRSDVLHHFLQRGSVKRFNPQILGTDGTDVKYVGLAAMLREKGEVVSALQYLHHPGTEDEPKAFSHWLVADLCSPEGLALVSQAVRHLGSEDGQKARLAFLHNTSPAPSLAASPGLTLLLLPRIILALTDIPSRRSKLVPVLARFLATREAAEASRAELAAARALAVVDVAVGLAAEGGLKAEGLREALTETAAVEAALARLAQEKAFVAAHLGVASNRNAVITNGRVLEIGGSFVAEDFVLLEAVEQKKSEPVAKVIAEIEWEVGTENTMDLDDFTSDFLSTVTMAASSEIWARERKGEFANLDPVFEKVTESVIVEEDEAALFSLEGILNPLSASAQAFAPLLVMLQDWLRPAVRLVLNPQLSLADVPLKNFFRYAQLPKEDFTESGALGSGPSVVFANMPQSRTLTMNLKVPEPWLVEPTLAVYDLDNLVLEKIPERSVHAIFELEALMITGHCYEEGEPPRGLQLVLGTPQQPHAVDTTVMANLGYFQLKAAPALWTLQLAPGRSSELYTLAAGNSEEAAGPSSLAVVVGDLRGKLVQLEVARREGREGERLLQGEDEAEDAAEWGAGLKQKPKSVWSSVLKAFGGGGQEDEDASEVVPTKPKTHAAEAGHNRSGETIHIFSIASGHLYERFTKIMILSVIRNTRRPVKFWFIKNYLSPSFKDVIPVMAHHYGFEAELVTYKWPSWLHKQTEKQRLIWAYKILFLDVLFPLSLKKVIFVDADQVVRTDMGELYDMDLQGKPLAYTPMCDNNVEMEGYRFWKQGFWRDHLQGKPYHISALYVVDLVKFRQMAAGDQLRVFYENLSKDPNSLANLDQDLPNYAQHGVPIFSLPQHWLWCESWCGNATKAAAKTIDLCNNPMTKEPKLEGARRIVAEWPGLDEEQRRFTERVESGEIDLEGVHSSVLTSSGDEGNEVERASEIELREAEEANLGLQQGEETGEEGSGKREEL